MKNSTKAKLIRGFKRLINYREEVSPFIDRNIVEIQTNEAKFSVTGKTSVLALSFYKKELELRAVQSLSLKLYEEGLIKFYEKESKDGSYFLTGVIKVIVPIAEMPNKNKQN